MAVVDEGWRLQRRKKTARGAPKQVKAREVPSAWGGDWVAGADDGRVPGLRGSNRAKIDHFLLFWGAAILWRHLLRQDLCTSIINGIVTLRKTFWVSLSIGNSTDSNVLGGDSVTSLHLCENGKNDRRIRTLYNLHSIYFIMMSCMNFTTWLYENQWYVLGMSTKVSIKGLFVQSTQLDRQWRMRRCPDGTLLFPWAILTHRHNNQHLLEHI